MSAARPNDGPKKRKQTANPSDASNPPKKPRAEANPLPQQQKNSLIGPHEAIIADLSPKRNILAASVISSTQIRKRVANVTSHLLDATPALPSLALLHARTAEVCKLITVVEQCKRVLGEQGKAWYQYNQLFDLPPEATRRKRHVVEETILEKGAEDDSDSESDAFEAMESRFENAVLPPPRARTHKSMRIFLSLEAVPELKSRQDVTVQSSEEAKS